MIFLARTALNIAEQAAVDLVPFQTRGSERSYFRLRWGNASAIVAQYSPSRVENTYFAAIAEFLREIGVPAPRLILHDPAACVVVMEDLGDTDLWALRNAPWERRRSLYQQTLSAVHKLHVFPVKEFPHERVKLADPFGADLYGWERDYFKGNFVERLCGIHLAPQCELALQQELGSLAERLMAGARCLVHRDLQSQNVMIRQGEPFLIDFQGMRLGSPFYDLGSLLCDPYVSFSAAEREELLAFYYSLSGKGMDWEAFRRAFWEAAAQRLMQALGAYAFLGLDKGLRSFLGHVPAGLRNLRLAAEEAASLPQLHELTARCASATSRTA
jgi:aminoglycoside/choline kinase family phosphotransferase